MYDDYYLKQRLDDGSYRKIDLNPDEHLTACSLIKNRRGSKNVYLLNTDLDRNLWQEKNGILIPKEKKNKKELMW